MAEEWIKSSTVFLFKSVKKKSTLDANTDKHRIIYLHLFSSTVIQFPTEHAGSLAQCAGTENYSNAM